MASFAEISPASRETADAAVHAKGLRHGDEEADLEAVATTSRASGSPRNASTVRTGVGAGAVLRAVVILDADGKVIYTDRYRDQQRAELRRCDHSPRLNVGARPAPTVRPSAV